MVAAGDVDHQEMVSYFEPVFESAPGENGLSSARSVPLSNGGLSVHFKELEQVHVCLGGEAPSQVAEKRFACAILNTIFGGSMSSRLFQEIREKRGLAYSVYSYLSANSDSGYAAIYLGVDPRSLSKSVDLVRRELAKIKEDDITSDELTGAVQYGVSGIYLAAENMEARMSSLAKNEYYFGRHLPLEEMIAGLSAVKVEEVSALARTLFGNGKIPVAVIGPVAEEQIMEDIIQ